MGRIERPMTFLQSSLRSQDGGKKQRVKGEQTENATIRRRRRRRSRASYRCFSLLLAVARKSEPQTLPPPLSPSPPPQRTEQCHRPYPKAKKSGGVTFSGARRKKNLSSLSRRRRQSSFRGEFFVTDRLPPPLSSPVSFLEVAEEGRSLSKECLYLDKKSKPQLRQKCSGNNPAGYELPTTLSFPLFCLQIRNPVKKGFFSSILVSMLAGKKREDPVF